MGTLTEAPATEKQVDYLGSLYEARGANLEDAARKAIEHGLNDGFGKAEASEFISLLLATRPAVIAADNAKPKSGLDLSGLPSGKYAVPGGDTRLKVLVQNVDKGKWAGFVFVKDAAVYGNGKRYGSQKPGGTYRGDIADALAAILADPHAAMAAYGHLTGSCGRCGLHLEDAVSVARGIGPVCIKKLGW